MSEGADWSQPEMVRAINRLSHALEQFEDGVHETFSGLDTKYVPREVFESTVLRFTEAIRAIEVERQSARTWVRDLVAPIITGLIVGLLLLFLHR